MKLSPQEIARREREGDRRAAEEALVRLPKGKLLLGYQARTLDILRAGTGLLVIEKSRRIGLTWALAAHLVLQAAKRQDQGGQNGWYMGYDKDMTQEFIEVCAMWARVFQLAASAVSEEVLNDPDGDVLVFAIRFASGNRITALPSVPRALRGKQGIVVIDEAAFHKNVAEVLKSAMALRIWGGQVIVVSTHDGISNPFNMLINEIQAKERSGKTLRITFDEAIADGLWERVGIVAKAKGADILPKAEWIADIRGTYGADAEEELDCIPKVGSGSLLSIEDIAACEHDDCGIPELYAGGLCYVGRDVARRLDGQIQYCMEMLGDVLWQRDTYEEIGQSFAHQDAFFNGLFKTRRIVSAWIDQTGMGEKVVEDLQLLHGTRVHGELLTGPHRVDLAISLQQRFQRQRIRIRFDPQTRSDLLAIKKVGSEESGGLRIVNEGKVHADRFWAYALASRAADIPPLNYDGYRSVGGGLHRKPEFGFHPDDNPNFGRGSRFGQGAF